MSNDLAIHWDESSHKLQHKLGRFVQYFQLNLPTLNGGIPAKLVDPGILVDALMHTHVDDVPDDLVEQATVDLDYEEGFPTIEGRPIWERLDGERVEFYKIFKAYRDMIKLTGTRSIIRVSTEINVATKFLHTLSKVYHWKLRCAAFDSYERVVVARKREYDTIHLEGKHGQAASLMLEKGLAYLDAHPEQLNPKVALQMVELGMKAGRVTLGLSTGSPAQGGSGARVAVNVQQNAAAGEVQAIMGSSEVKAPEEDKMESILHILQTSGAFDKPEERPPLVDITPE